MSAQRRVYIVEKPSVAKELAAFMGVAKRHLVGRGHGYYVTTNGDRVVHQLGHMREIVDLDRQLPVELRGRWRWEQLAVLPEKLATEPKPDSDEKGKKRRKADGTPIPSPQYEILLECIRWADVIVNAGDIDKEGQLVADEILEAAGVDPCGNKKPVERVLLTAMDDVSLGRALSASRPSNGEARFVNLRMAALARRDADFLVGIFLSRALSIASDATVPVGRVMTAVLSLVVKRELEIRAFKPVQFWIPVVRLADGLEMEWKGRPGSAGTPGFDSEGRIIDRRLAEQIVRDIEAGMRGEVTRAEGKNKSIAPPLTHSIAQLQVELGARAGIDPETTMKTAQALYDRKAITYIGTDCRYLPESMHADGRAILGGLAGVFGKACTGANSQIKSPAFSDKALGDAAHHAIIPTQEIPSGLNETERVVYEAIARRYIAQFHGNYEYRASVVEAEFGKDTFSSSWNQVVKPGWQSADPEPAYRAMAARNGVPKSAADPDQDEAEASAEDDDSAEEQQRRATAKDILRQGE